MTLRELIQYFHTRASQDPRIIDYTIALENADGDINNLPMRFEIDRDEEQIRLFECPEEDQPDEDHDDGPA
jgi:hypothetical protein